MVLYWLLPGRESLKFYVVYSTAGASCMYLTRNLIACNETQPRNWTTSNNNQRNVAFSSCGTSSSQQDWLTWRTVRLQMLLHIKKEGLRWPATVHYTDAIRLINAEDGSWNWRLCKSTCLHGLVPALVRLSWPMWGKVQGCRQSDNPRNQNLEAKLMQWK